MQVLRDLESATRSWKRWNCAPSYLDHRGRRLKEARAIVALPDFARAIGDTETAYLKACGAAQTQRRLMTVAGSMGLMLALCIIAGLFEATALRAAMRSAVQRLVLEGLPTQAAQFAIAGTVGETEISTLIHASDARGSLRDTGFTLKLLLNLPQPHVAEEYRMSKDGTRLVTQASDHSGAIWDIDRATKLADLGPNGSVVRFVITDDDTRLITRSSDNAFTIWDLQSGARIGGSGSATYAKATLESGINRLVTLSESGTAMLWDVQIGAQIATLGEPNEIDGWGIITTPPRIVTRSRQKAGQLWDAITGQVIADLGGPGSCESCGFSPDGSRLLARQTAGHGLLLDAHDARLIGKIDPGSRLSGYAFNSDGTRLITRTIYSRLVLWDTVTATQLAEIGISDADNYKFSPNGRQIVTRSTNSSGALLDARDGSLLVTFGPSLLKEYQFSSKTDRLVITTADKAAALWNSATGDKIVDLAGPNQVETTEFSPDGSRLSVGSRISTGALWDAGTGTKLTDYEAKAQADGQVIFSADGTRIAMASGNNFGVLLDAQTGQNLVNLGGEGAVYAVSLSADGQRVATQSVYETVAVWDGSIVSQPAAGPRLKTYVCSINYNAIGVFPGEVRSGAAHPEGVDVELAQHLRGRPWHPCDWRGLLSLEGWGQLLRFWAVKIGVPWDYRCGEKKAFGGIDPVAIQLCPP